VDCARAVARRASLLPRRECEQIIEEKQRAVDEAFERFREWLADGAIVT